MCVCVYVHISIYVYVGDILWIMGKEHGNYRDCRGILGVYRDYRVYIFNTWTP